MRRMAFVDGPVRNNQNQRYDEARSRYIDQIGKVLEQVTHNETESAKHYEDSKEQSLCHLLTDKVHGFDLEATGNHTVAKRTTSHQQLHGQQRACLHAQDADA